MGAWSVGSFENDDALDFLAEITESDDLSLIRKVFDNVITSTEYVEAPDACQAIVGAEIIAAAIGRPTAEAQQNTSLNQWLTQIQPTIDNALIVQAIEALTLILAPNSELRELWEDSEYYAEWKSAMIELRQQLEA
jgi:hypothetical protein